MGTAAEDYETDEEREEREAAERADRGNAAARRIKEREEKDKELTELRAFKAEQERREALAKAKDDLGAVTGPLGLFLKTYTGEPTADAIRKAVADDPDAKDAITFEPDPRDTAAAQQAADAAKRRGADPVATKALQSDVRPGPDRLRAYHEKKAAGAATTT